MHKQLQQRLSRSANNEGVVNLEVCWQAFIYLQGFFSLLGRVGGSRLAARPIQAFLGGRMHPPVFGGKGTHVLLSRSAGGTHQEVSATDSVLLFFIDGLGIGTRGSENPLAGLPNAEPLAVFQNEETLIPNDGLLVVTDPRLGVEGRPQSASGQTTILTGINAPGLLGYHKQGFPNAAMRQIIAEHSIFLQLKMSGIGPVTFANAYTHRFFDERPRWVSATTAAVEAAGLQFRNVEDLKNNRAVYQDFTNQFIIERGENIEPRSPAGAAEVLAGIVAENRFTLYEYFITDKIGHKQDFEAAQTVLQNLAAFVRELLRRIDLTKTSVILTSDHGNIEDLSSRNHTLNDVPTIVWGANRERIARRIKNLADITPAIVESLTKKATIHR